MFFGCLYVCMTQEPLIYIDQGTRQNNRNFLSWVLKNKFWFFDFYSMIFLTMIGTFPKAFSQVATSQICNFPSSKFLIMSQLQRSAPFPILVAALGPLPCSSRSARLAKHCINKYILLQMNVYQRWMADVTTYIIINAKK